MASTTADGVRTLMAELRGLGVRLRVDDGALRMEAPRGAVGPALLARVREHRDGIVRVLRADGETRVAATLRRLADEPRAVYPLSRVQERLLYPQLSEPDLLDYNITTVLRVPAPVDADAVETALRAVVRRHEGFRTGFALGEDEPVQTVAAEVDLVLEHTGPAPFDPSRPGDFVRPFDPARPPLLRARLHTVDATERYLLLDTHHLVFDAASRPVLLADLRRALRGALPEPTTPALKEYALWQRRLDTPLAERQGRYWADLLAAPPPPGTPAVAVHPGEALGDGDFRGARLRLDAGTVAAVRRLCRAQALSPSMFHLAAYSLAVQEVGGRPEAVIGFPVDVRADAGLPATLGPLVNIVLVRVSAAGAGTVRAYLENVRRQVISALEHAHYPYDAMVDEVAGRRSVRDDPVVDGFFAYAVAEPDDGEEAGLSRVDRGAVDFPVLPCLSSRFAVTLSVTDGAEVFLDVERDSTQIGEETCRAFGDRALALTRALAGDPDRPLAALSPGLAALARPAAAHRPPAAHDLLGVVLPLRPEGTEPPLFCVHPALSLAWCYAPVLGHLPPERPVFGLQSASLLHPAHLATSVEEIAERYLAEVRALQPHGPYHLLGWSFGGLVAQEMAVRMREAGESVALLAVMDGAPLPRWEVTDEELRREALSMLLGSDEAAEAACAELPADASGARVKAHVDARNPVFADLDAATFETLLTSTVNHCRLMLGHRPRAYDGELLFFASGRRHADGVAPEAARWRPSVRDVERVELDCWHLEMTRPEWLARIAARIDGRLRSWDEGPGTTTHRGGRR